MFERIVGDARRAVATELRLVAIGVAAALAATLSPLSAAALVSVVHRYDALRARLIVAGF